MAGYAESMKAARALEERLRSGEAVAQAEIDPLLADEEPSIRMRATVALSLLDPVHAAPALSRVITECLREGRAARQVADAVVRLAELGEQTLLDDVLLEAEAAVLDAGPKLRGFVAANVLAVLVAVSGDDRPRRLLRRLAEVGRGATPSAAIRALAESGDSESRDRLRARMRAGDSRVFFAALRALERLEGRRGLAIVVEEILRARAETPPVEPANLLRYAKSEAHQFVTGDDATRFREGLEALVMLERLPAVIVARDIARALPRRGIRPPLARFLRANR